MKKFSKDMENNLNVGDKFSYDGGEVEYIIRDITYSKYEDKVLYLKVQEITPGEKIFKTYSYVSPSLFYGADFIPDERNNFLESMEISFEISESGLTIDEVKAIVEAKYPGWKFNRTESRYDSCIMAIFEKN